MSTQNSNNPDHGGSEAMFEQGALLAELSRNWWKKAGWLAALCLAWVVDAQFTMSQLLGIEIWLSQHYVGLFVLIAVSIFAKMEQARACAALLPLAMAQKVTAAQAAQAEKALRLAKTGILLDRLAWGCALALIFAGLLAGAAKEVLNSPIPSSTVTVVHGAGVIFALMLRLSSTSLVVPASVSDLTTCAGRAVTRLLDDHKRDACGLTWFDSLTDFETVQILGHVVRKRLETRPQAPGNATPPEANTPAPTTSQPRSESLVSGLKVNDTVAWPARERDGRTTRVGVIEAVVPAGQPLPDNVAPGAWAYGRTRDHESYLVRVGQTATTKGKLYWPNALFLTRAVPLAAPSPAEAPLPPAHEC